ncbi:MAG TPA: hypothetical protein VEH10_05150 [Thermoplasmata archaeon]|nr:hypothetical protein [Thermoplasmata archaeon]
MLGLEGSRNFLVQHELLSGGRNYRILNHEKRHLFTVREDVREELAENVLGGSAATRSGFRIGQVAPGTRVFAWTVADAQGTAQGAITIQVHGLRALSTLVDGAGTPLLAVQVEKSLVGGLSATAAFPDGRAMFTAHGNLLRHNFSIRDPSGGEVAKIHEAWASVRDTYNLDVTGAVDPLFPIVFAILVDREKAEG